MSNISNIEEVEVVEIFRNMSYENTEEDFKILKEWLKKYDYFEETSEKTQLSISFDDNFLFVHNKVFQEVKSEDFTKEFKLNSQNWSEIDKLKKAYLLNNAVDEIEKHADLICQMEAFTNNILSKDTRLEGIPMLKNYFRYYAGWAGIVDKHFQTASCRSYCEVRVEQRIPIALLGMVVAPALAAGSTIIVHLKCIDLYPGVHLLHTILQDSGFPSVMSIVMDSTSLLYKSVRLGGEAAKPSNSLGSVLAALHVGQASMIMFEDCDCTSACEAALRAAFSSRALYPWSVGTVYIQATVFDKIVRQLKCLAGKLRITASGRELNCDVSHAQQNILDRIVVGRGTLPPGDGASLRALPFCSAEEAVALANDSCFGLAVSVWTESIGRVHQVVPQLQAGLVWVNGHGRMSAGLPLTPRKCSGQGYFGGKEGLMQHLFFESGKVLCPKKDLSEFLLFSGTFTRKSAQPSHSDTRSCLLRCLDGAKDAARAWQAAPASSRLQVLRSMAAKCSLDRVDPDLLQFWQECIFQYTTECCVEVQSAPTVQVTREPLGVIVIDAFYDLEQRTSWVKYLLKLVAAAWSYGNAVIIVRRNIGDELMELCKTVQSCGTLHGLLSVVFTDYYVICDTVENHPGMWACLSLSDVTEELIVPQVTRTKCVLTGGE